MHKKMKEEFNVNATKKKIKTNHGINTNWTIVCSTIPRYLEVGFHKDCIPMGKITNFEFLDFLFLNISCPKFQSTMIIKKLIQYMIIPIALINNFPTLN